MLRRLKWYEISSTMCLHTSKMSADKRSESSERLLVGVVSCCAVAVATCVIVLGRLVDNFAFIHLANLQPISCAAHPFTGQEQPLYAVPL